MCCHTELCFPTALFFTSIQSTISTPSVANTTWPGRGFLLGEGLMSGNVRAFCVLDSHI
jgi:hypothetical protein